MSNILITTGGTGGHIYPALAVADKLKEKGHNVIFVGTIHRMEKDLIPEKNYVFYGLDILPLRSFKSIMKLFKGIFEAKKIIKKEKIDIVIGFGNYISLPSLIAGKLAKKDIYLQEQNVKMGMANKLFITFCKKIFLAFSETKKFLSEKNQKKCIVTGNPLRDDFYTITKEKAREELKISSEEKVILIMGGSLGAKNINEVVLSKLDLFNQEKINVFWATGKALYEEINSKIEDKNRINIAPYFENPSIIMAASDLIICRAGASTISEIIQLSKPSILIPYDGVGQLENARVLESIGSAKVYNNEEVKIAINEAINIVKNKEKLSFMESNINSIKTGISAENIAENL